MKRVAQCFPNSRFFQHKEDLRFSWTNGQKSNSRRLVRLERFYIPNQSRLDFYHKAYYFHQYEVESDHSPIKLEISIGNSEIRYLAFK